MTQSTSSSSSDIRDNIEEVFHYTTLKVVIENILYEKQLRLNLVGLTNDPRENKSWNFPIIFTSYEGLPKKGELPKFPVDLMTMSAEASRVFQKEWKILCATCHHSELDLNDLQHNHQPFWPGYCKPKMWATYSGNHSGVCLRLATQEITSKLHKHYPPPATVISGLVKYDDFNSIAAFPIDVDKINNENIVHIARDYLFKYNQSFFFSKVSDWQAENEYRWLIHDLSESAIYIPIEGIIKEVICGPDFIPAYLPSLIELCKPLAIPISKLGWHNGIPDYSYGFIYKP